VVLSDGLRCRVINVEFLGNLNDIKISYIDDAPPFLNALDKFASSLFSYFFVFFGGQFDLNEMGFYVVADK